MADEGGEEILSSLDRVYRVMGQSFFYRLYEKSVTAISKKITRENKKKARQGYISSNSIFNKILFRKILEKKQLSLNYMSSSVCFYFLDRLIGKWKYYFSACVAKSYFYKQIQEVREVIKRDSAIIIAIIAISAVSTKWYLSNTPEWTSSTFYRFIYLFAIIIIIVIWVGYYFHAPSRKQKTEDL